MSQIYSEGASPNPRDRLLSGVFVREEPAEDEDEDEDDEGEDDEKEDNEGEGYSE